VIEIEKENRDLNGDLGQGLRFEKIEVKNKIWNQNHG
jgi:hypothetical protein